MDLGRLSVNLPSVPYHRSMTTQQHGFTALVLCFFTLKGDGQEVDNDDIVGFYVHEVKEGDDPERVAETLVDPNNWSGKMRSLCEQAKRGQLGVALQLVTGARSTKEITDAINAQCPRAHVGAPSKN